MALEEIDVIWIIRFVIVAFLSACSAGQDWRVVEEDARKAMYEKVREFSQTRQIAFENLPAPTVTDDLGRWIYDFRDEQQDIWIVAIVHPDGFCEISFTRISE